MKTLIFALILLTIALNSFSQSNEVDDEKFSPVEDFYKLNYLNGKNDGKGNTGIAADNDISAVYMNPATLNLDKKCQVNIQYTFKTTQSINLHYAFGNISYNLSHIFPSGYFGFGYKINDNFQAGFVYHNPGSMKQLYTEGVETMTGEKAYNNFVIHSFGFPAAYKLGNIIFGIIADVKLYTVEYNGVKTINDPNGNNTAKTNLWNFNAQFGIKFEPMKNLSLGLTLTPGFQKEVKYEGVMYVTERETFISKYPLKIGSGIQYKLMKNKLNLSADYNFEQLSKIAGKKDKHDFNLGAEYKASNTTYLRAGVFTMFDNRKANIYNLISDGEFTQYFITAGFTYKTKNIDISASILDSHISSGIIKNTYFNSSISYNF